VRTEHYTSRTVERHRVLMENTWSVQASLRVDKVESRESQGQQVDVNTLQRGLRANERQTLSLL